MRLGTASPAILGTLVGLLAACGQGGATSDVALLTQVLSEARGELGLPANLAVHPLLALWPEGPLDAPLTRFNLYDSASVAGLVDASAGAYRLCQRDRAGHCSLAPGQVSVVLSSIRELDGNDLALRLSVFDGRSATDVHRDHIVRLKRGWAGRWTVAEFRRLN